MLPFNFHHLYYFYTIAKAGSVSKAAKELHLSQPALSYQLKQLEDFLGVKLFERRGRKLLLTEDGRSAMSYAGQIFDTGKEFVDRLQDRSQKGRIRIQMGVLNSIPKAISSALLRFVLAYEPSTYVRLQEDTLERMIANLNDHLLDIILADMPFQSSSEDEIENYCIAKIPIVFCAHPNLGKQYKKIPRDLHDAPMIFPTSDSRTLHNIQEYLATHRITPRIVAEVQDIELTHRMVIEGLGIAPLNQLLAAHAPKSKLMILNQTAKTNIHESIYLIIKKRKYPHPLVEHIINQFRLVGIN